MWDKRIFAINIREKIETGQFDTAKIELQSYLAEHPFEADLHHYLGIVLNQLGENEDSRKCIARAIELSPDPEYIRNLAKLYKNDGLLSEAITTIERGIKLFPENPEVNFEAALLFFEKNEPIKVKELLENALKSRPNWHAAIINLGNIEKILGNYEKAEALYKKVLNESKNYPELYSNLGALYAEIGRFEEAIKYNKLAVDQAPQNSAFHYNLGNAYLAISMGNEAERCFQKALDITPNYTNALINLAASKQQSGAIEEALKISEKLIKLAPEEAKVWTNLAGLMLNLKRLKDAIGCAEKAITLDKRNVTAWTTLAEILRQLGYKKKALSAVHQATSINEHYSRALIIGATLEEEQGNTIHAEALLRCASTAAISVGIIQNNLNKKPEALLRLANLYCTEGKLERSKECFISGLQELKRARPALCRLSEERALLNTDLVLLRPIGRAGSLFFHSLFDGHPEIMTTPAVLMKGFFGEGVWEGIYPNAVSGNANWKTELIDRFCKLYEPMFDASSALPVPGNPLGDPANVTSQAGLQNMGAAADKFIKIDLAKFKDKLLKKLEGRINVSAPAFFLFAHQAWVETVENEEIERKVLLFHIHNPDVIELAGCLDSFRTTKFLNIVREPIQALESWMHGCLRDCRNPEEILAGYQAAVERVNLMLKQFSHIVHDIYESKTIRLEDIKRNSDDTLERLCRWLNIKNHPSLKYSSFAGLQYEAPSWFPVKGFGLSNLERSPGFFFSPDDIRVFKTILYPISKAYGYEESGELQISEEISWVETRIKEALDFEIKIKSHLDSALIENEFYGPYTQLRSIFKSCLAALKHTGTYPCSAANLLRAAN